MDTRINCERCSEVMLPDPFHLGSDRQRYCRTCFVVGTAEYLSLHPEQAAGLARSLHMPWPDTGVDTLAIMLVVELESTRAKMASRFSRTGLEVQ